MKFDIKLEQEILAKSLKDHKYLKSAARVLNSHHFATKELSWVWETIYKNWNKYKELSSKRLFAINAKTDFAENKEDRLRYYGVALKLFKLKTKSPKSGLEELTKFVRYVNAQKCLENAANNLEKGKIDSAYAEFRSMSKKDMFEQRNYVIAKFEDFSERQKERKKVRDNPELLVKVPTGFKKLDRILTGGLKVGQIGLVMATTSQGKSAMLTNLAHTAIFNPIRKFNVAYFAFEMSAEEILQRQDARWLCLDYEKFQAYEFTKRELKKIKVARKKMKKSRGLLRVSSHPLGVPTIDIVRQSLDDMFEDDGFRPNLVLLDSPDHMKPSVKQQDIRLSHTAVYQEVKAFADEEGFAIWSSTHAGREWAKKVATAEASGESYDKSRIADIVLSLNTPEKITRSTRVVLDDDDMDGEQDPSALATGRYMELFVAKNRSGRSRILIPFDATFSKILFQEMEG